MEQTEKKVIRVVRRIEPFKCKRCGHMVDVNHAKTKITETDKYILHGWDYGHEHKRIFEIQVIEGVETQFEVSNDY